MTTDAATETETLWEREQPRSDAATDVGEASYTLRQIEIQEAVKNGDIARALRLGGELGEDLAAEFLVAVEGRDLLVHHGKGDAPQGIDLAATSAGDPVRVVEVKTIVHGDYHLPVTAMTRDGRQMDARWISERLDATGLNLSPGDVVDVRGPVSRELVQVDLVRGVLARFELSDDGSRQGSTPVEVWPLDELITLFDALHLERSTP
jgi:hypothetical protein